MRTARFFVPEEWIARQAKAFSIPAGAIHRQLVNVLRMKVGDAIGLMTDDGHEIDGRITEISRSSIMGEIVGVTSSKPLRPDVTICAAVTKRDTFELTLQKCTELGVNAFIPILTKRVIKKPDEVPQRWRDIVREASEQSGRMTLPVIHEPMTLNTAIAKTSNVTRIVMHESDGETSMPKVKEMDHVALFVGPEGGFTEDEIAQLRANGTTVVKLGSTVLRAETAAIAGATLLRLR